MNIKKEINDFISTEESNGALLVTGKWGCGKTYILKQFVEEANKESHFLVVLLSLFGIDNVETLNQAVKESVFFAKGFDEHGNAIKKGFSKIKETIAPISNALSDYSKIAKGVNTALTIKWQDFFKIESEISCKQNGETMKKRLVLIFDDFERSEIDIVDLMGAINEYSENKNIKVVVVADEGHIENTKYKDFKEKLISRTIKLIPDHKETIRSIVVNYKETVSGYCNFLKENLVLILEIFAESQTQNLRSLKSFLMDFERAYAVWRKSEISTHFLQYVFYDFGAMLFTVKSGQYKEGRYGDLFVDNEISKKYKRWSGTHKLSSLKKWVVDGVWNEEDFNDEIHQKYGIKNMTDEQKFLNFDFWSLEDRHIEQGMPIAVEKAYAGELSRNEIFDLLKKIYALKKYGIASPVEVDYAKMQEGFSIRAKKILASEIEEPKLHISIFNDQIEPGAKKLHEEITKFDNRLITFNNRKVIFDYFNPDSKISEYSINGLIIGAFDKQLLETFLVYFYGADNGRKRDYARVILNLGYTDKTFITPEETQETLDNFAELKERLDKYKTTLTDRMSIAIVNETLKEIDKLIENIKGLLELG